MGEVYRARDSRIGRDVALKVMHASHSSDPKRARRFEREARAAGKLNHPAVVVIYDVGEHDGASYVVSELLEGRTLRDRLREGKVPPREAIRWAAEIAGGLSAAHQAGIVHRDLKPENLFLRREGGLKILDFGIAKLAHDTGDAAPALSDASTASLGTASGVILGTAGFMAPEQVRGERVDHRADLFALGAILYEMVEGRPAFGGETVVERLHAILKDPPPARGRPDRDEPAGLQAVLDRCLAKRPEERFESAAALQAAFSALLVDDAPTASPLQPAKGPPRRARSRIFIAAAMAAGLALAAYVANARLDRQVPAPAVAAASATPVATPALVPSYRQLTFGAGQVSSAKFAPDGRTVIYGAAWSSDPVELYTTRTESAGSRALGIAGADVLSISSRGEMAIVRGRRYWWWPGAGTLARAPLVGGAPRDLIVDVQSADWSPDGETMAIARRVGEKWRLEYPEGTVLYETNGWISDLRVSPDGNLVAFLDHPFANDDMGDVAVIDFDRKKTTLATGWMSEQGLAWSPSGDEVWFSAAGQDSPYAIYAARLDGTRRTVTRGPIKLILHDISRDGRVLLSHDSARAAVMANVAGTAVERDVSSLDLTLVAAISPDGKSVLLSEQSSSGGKGYDIFLRGADGPVHLGTGLAADLSADGKRTVALSGTADHVKLLSNGVGAPQLISHEGLAYRDVRFFPDGERLLVLGVQGKDRPRFFEQSITGGAVRALTAEADRLAGGCVSPDGKLIGFIEGKAIRVQPVVGGEARTLGEAAEGDELDGFIDDGRALLVHRRGERPARVYRIDVATGKKALWKQIVPADPAGFVEVTRLRATPDGRSYAYTYFRVLSTLYLVEGLR